ncbi:MAG: hypothetical protein AAGD92_08935 [Pseudomonadota bacterium]
MLFLRVIIAVAGLVLILVGAATAVTPIPFGLPLAAVGFLLFASAMPGILRRLRRRWRWLDKRLVWLQSRLPDWLSRTLRRSDPHQEELEEERREEENEDAKNSGDNPRSLHRMTPAAARALLARKGR